MKASAYKLALVAFLVLGLAACGSPRGRDAGGKVRAYGGPRTRPDPASVREISLVNPKNGEKVEGAYFHDSAYDPQMMDAINRLFRDRRTGEIYPIDPELIDFLVDIRTRLALPPSIPFEILSGYRSPETNESLRETNSQVAKESLHMRGYAVDFRLQGVNGNAIAEIAKTMQRGGVSYYPTDNHLHVDIGAIRSWGYSATF